MNIAAITKFRYDAYNCWRVNIIHYVDGEFKSFKNYDYKTKAGMEKNYLRLLNKFNAVEKYHLSMERKDLRFAQFTIDGIPTDKKLQGFSDGTTWNGFDNVYTTLEGLEDWVEGTGQKITFNEDESVTFDMNGEADDETFEVRMINGTKLYCLSGWCFAEVK